MSEPVFEDPRKVLARHGLRAKRAFSQNFLVSRHAVDAIAAALAPQPGEAVVELGPGLGTLTAALVRAGAERVLVVERDADMRRIVTEELGARVEVVGDDATTVDLAALAASHGKLALCGNLPYAVTGAILRALVEARESVSRCVVMVQREVRDRLLAVPGTREWGALTVFTQAAFDVRPVMLVSPGSFHPPPKVTSAVVRLVPRAAPLAEETDALRAVVRAIFDARRKTLRNSLRGAGLEADAMLSRAAIDGERRGETLSIEELARLAACR